MYDLANLPDAELESLRLAIAAEQSRRRYRCDSCGGQTRAWHLHICDEAGGANIPMNSDIARQLTRSDHPL